MGDRREFLKYLAALTAGIMLPIKGSDGKILTLQDRLGELLPLRKLGSTGENVTMLGVGGAHIGLVGEKMAQAIIEKALQEGVRFFDNAESYSGGHAERYYGQFLTPKYRDVAFIMTKTTARDAATARKHLEGSLSRMKTDYVDLWQIHAVSSPEDVDERIKNGVLDMVLEAKESGKAKYIGFTGHSDFNAHAHMLEQTNDLQTCQFPINIYDPNYKSFIRNVLPQAVDMNLGVIAMKTLANGGFFGGTRHYEGGPNPRIVPGTASIREALHFVWSLPVSVALTGAHTPEMLQEKIDLAKSFTQMDEANRLALIDRVSGFDGRKVEFYKV